MSTPTYSRKTNQPLFIVFYTDSEATFSQLLECKCLFLLLVILIFLWQEILLFYHGGQLRAFTLTLLLPLLWQRPRQEPEWDTGQQDHSASHYEAQPPGPHPAGVLIVYSDGV